MVVDSRQYRVTPRNIILRESDSAQYDAARRFLPQMLMIDSAQYDTERRLTLRSMILRRVDSVQYDTGRRFRKIRISSEDFNPLVIGPWLVRMMKKLKVENLVGLSL